MEYAITLERLVAVGPTQNNIPGMLEEHLLGLSIVPVSSLGNIPGPTAGSVA